MQKTFCDKCGKELEQFDFIAIDYKDFFAERKRINKNLCGTCKFKFLQLVLTFFEDEDTNGQT